jgi:putative hemin transport protein
MNHTAIEIDYDPAEEIKTRYELLKEQKPDIRARNAAIELDISEGELLASRVGEEATRLIDDAETTLSNLAPLGELMALTRNESCVHERKGIYENAEFSKHGPMAMGLFANPDIDLRLFMNHWKYSFAVNENDRKSLQFFDKSGDAVHKIYLTLKSDEAAYDALVEKYTHAQQDRFIEIESYDPKAADRPDSEIDWSGLRTAWENLQDTHDFFPMLCKFKVGREQSFRKIGQDFAYEVENDGARKVLELVRDRECEMMVFVGNRGCLQIHSGQVKKLVEHGPWYNVLDPKFNLHLREDQIGRTWVTKKPTEDGIVTALEIFDTEGEIIATFFGKRKPGIPELTLWREIIADIPAKELANAA